MTFTDRFIALLLARPEVAHYAGTRVYATRAPRSASYPLVVVQMIDGGRGWHLGGPDGLRHPRVQVRCWAKTATEARRLADAVDEIDGFRGPFGGMEFQAINAVDEHEGDEPPQDADDVALFYVQIDFEVWYTR